MFIIFYYNYKQIINTYCYNLPLLMLINSTFVNKFIKFLHLYIQITINQFEN